MLSYKSLKLFLFFKLFSFCSTWVIYTTVFQFTDLLPESPDLAHFFPKACFISVIVSSPLFRPASGGVFRPAGGCPVSPGDGAGQLAGGPRPRVAVCSSGLLWAVSPWHWQVKGMTLALHLSTPASLQETRPQEWLPPAHVPRVSSLPTASPGGSMNHRVGLTQAPFKWLPLPQSQSVWKFALTF